MSEGDLWATAIEYAFRAACLPIGPQKNNAGGGGCEPSEAADEWRFLTDTKGGWAESRHIICWINGVDPEIVRNEALRRGISRQAQYGLLRGEERAVMLAMSSERDQRILEEYAAGRPIPEMAAAYGLSEYRIRQLAGEYGVKRPKNNKWAGSAVEVRGDRKSRAAGGGVVRSFHAQNMPAGEGA